MFSPTPGAEASAADTLVVGKRFVDIIVERKDLKGKLSQVLEYLI